MEKLKLAEAQIAFILRHSKEDTAIGEILRKAGISDSMLMPSKASRLHQLKDENRKLKKVVAELLQYTKMLEDRRRKL